MTPALRYLLATSLRNGIIARLKRLRQPKYFFAALVGAAYFYFYFYRFLFGGGLGGPGRNAPGTPVLVDASWQAIGAATLLVAMLVFAWILPGSRAAITFTEAEIAFLFPAPISRRMLVTHKLLKSQLGFLIIASVMTFLTGRFRAGTEAWFRVGGWWVILNTLSMHRIGASFALQRLRERGMADPKRRILFGTALAGLIAVVVMIWKSLPPLPALIGAGAQAGPDLNGIIGQIAHSGPVPYLLTPFRWITAPYFAHHLDGFVSTLVPALAIMVLHFLWVVRADIAFEEASIVASQKRAAAVDAQRRGEFRLRSKKARRPLWRLRPTGFAPTGFLWKSLIKFGGKRAGGLWAIFFFMLSIGAQCIHQFPGQRLPNWAYVVAGIVGVGCYATVLISFVMVGQSATAQLRQGMTAMDLLKTYPLPGWQLALGELSGPLLIGSLLQWASLGIAALLTSALANAITPGAGNVIGLVASGLAIVLPAFNISMSILPSAAALLFPAWFKPDEAGGRGLEATGIRLVVGIAQLAAMVAMLLPVAFFGACGWVLADMWVTSLLGKALVAGGIGAFVLALEAALGVAWLGKLYDRYDMANT